MDDPPPLVDIEQARFYSRACFFLIGRSGTGKTTALTEALLEPRRHFRFDGGDLPTHLFVFAGASNDFANALRDKLDRSVFHKVGFPEESIGQCEELKRSLATSKGRRRHVIIVDDYASSGPSDIRFVQKLLTSYKRHENCTIVIGSHMFLRSPANYMIADNSDRVYFTRHKNNRSNLTQFARRLGVPPETIANAHELMSAPPQFGLAMYCSATSLFVGDARMLERREPLIGVADFSSSERGMKYFIVAESRLRRRTKNARDDDQDWSSALKAFSGAKGFATYSFFASLLRSAGVRLEDGGDTVVFNGARCNAAVLLRNLAVPKTRMDDDSRDFLKRLRQHKRTPEILFRRLKEDRRSSIDDEPRSSNDESIFE